MIDAIEITNRDRIWRPFTQMLNAEPPLMVRSGTGVFLELADGRKLVDCISSWWVNIHGHARPEIADAIAAQARNLEQVIFAGFTHEPAEKLSEILLAHMPKNLQHVFYSDNGSTAVEVALKLAFQFWLNQGINKKKFIAFEGGYHGDTAGSMSIGQGSPFWNTFEPLLFSIELAPYPSTFDGDASVQEKESQSLERLKQILEREEGNIAAICIEPLIQGAGGMRFCRQQFLKELRSLCDKYNVLLIFDEVMTGFGRTGDWFAANKCNIQPDIMCVSKGITGGFLPLSVTACSTTIYDGFLSKDHSKTFFHGHSYTANPLACAAALASMALLDQNPKVFTGLEERHRSFVNKHLKNHPKLIQQRVCGTIFAAEIFSQDGDNYFNNVAPILKKRFIEKGFLIRPLGNTVYLMPPYCIEDTVLENAYQVIAEVCAEV